MTVVFRLSDLLHELFPHDEGDTEALLSAMRAHYRLGDVEPTVTIEGEMVIVEVDEQHSAGHEQLFDEAWKDCTQGRYAAAKPKLLKLVAQAPWNGNYHAILGQVCSELGEQEEAMDHLIEALRWEPTNHRALVMMGNIWAKHRREPDTALTYLKEALLLRPDDHIAATNIASQLMELKRPEEARGYLEQAIRSAPEYPNTRFAMAELLKAAGEIGEAFEQAEQLYTATP